MSAETTWPTRSEGVAEGTTASQFTRNTSLRPVCGFDPATLTIRVDTLVESKIEAINPVVEEIMRLLTANCCPPNTNSRFKLPSAKLLPTRLSTGITAIRVKKFACAVAVIPRKEF